MTDHAIDPPNALAVRREALDRAARFLEQRGYNFPVTAPELAVLTRAADAILAWLIQPLPREDDPMAEPELAQQATNVQATPQFRDLTPISRHTGPAGVWHAGPYALCVICQTGHGAIPAGSTGIAVGPGPTNRYAPTPIIHEMTEAECSPLARKQHALAEAQIVRVTPGGGAECRALEGEGQVPAMSNPPKSADANTPIPQGGTGSLTLLPSARDHEESGLSRTYKRPY